LDLSKGAAAVANRFTVQAHAAEIVRLLEAAIG
jgi:hypothetical protein